LYHTLKISGVYNLFSRFIDKLMICFYSSFHYTDGAPAGAADCELAAALAAAD
jgi:hypothetical protein